MGKIKVLTPDIFNKISAGEVVENPAAVVKELVENSIDAGAMRIVVETVDGGMKSITVTDNGCGMEADDIDVCFLKHATSKILSAEEIFGVTTLVFRGEALASIAAVAEVKLTTRHASSDMAICAVAKQGVVVSKQFVSANVGTTIEVKDLFYNTPARKKFLKSPAREGTEITKYMTKLALVNPYLELTYIADGQTVFQTKGKGLEETIFTIYGPDCLSNCLPINTEFKNARLRGYIGNPEFTKANSTYQTISVNGRPIVDKNIQAAILQAYRPYLMTRRYPFYVLDLDIITEDVDVNVHPKKTEVRFANNQKVFTIFYVSVKEALQKYSHQRADEIMGQQGQQVADTKVTHIQDNYLANFDAYQSAVKMNPDQAKDVIEIELLTEAEEKRLRELAVKEDMRTGRSVQAMLQRLSAVDQNLEDGGRMQVDIYADVRHDPEFDENDEGMLPEPLPPEPPKDEYDDLYAQTRILGVAFNTYLILELEEKIILVDQHAAHERILYNKFLEGKFDTMQPVLIPYTFTVKPEEADFIMENLKNVLKAGVEIQPFGLNSFRIVAVSTHFVDTKMEKFVDYLLESVDEYKLDSKKLFVEKLAKKACKAAIKAGQKLNEFEIKYIIKEIHDGKIVQCPHGRPVTVVMTKSQIEKMFKRIV